MPDKNKNSNEIKRIEYQGKNVRLSRTGGASVRAEGKVGSVNVTANSKHGIRLSTRLAKGTFVALQKGRFRLVGRWGKGPFSVNLSKSGVSASYKNEVGTYNFVKPRYSSFKYAGIQFRGKRAARFQEIFLFFKLIVWIGDMTLKFGLLFIELYFYTLLILLWAIAIILLTPIYLCLMFLELVASIVIKALARN